MDRASAVARIQRGLGFRSDRADDIISALQEEQRDLEKGKTLPRFLLVEDASIALLQGENAVALPTDFLRRSETLVHYIPIYSSYPRKIPWRDYDAARSAYGNYNPGGPSVVALRETTLWFEPLADRDYSLTWTYYGRANLLTSNDENAWLDDDNVPELLIGGAGLRIALDMRNEEAVKVFSIMQATARKALLSEVANEEAFEVMTLGGAS